MKCNKYVCCKCPFDDEFAESPLTLSTGLSIYGARKNGAGIAQLVEPYLAKVAVASSSLVSRSTFVAVQQKWSEDQC